MSYRAPVAADVFAAKSSPKGSLAGDAIAVLNADALLLPIHVRALFHHLQHGIDREVPAGVKQQRPIGTDGLINHRRDFRFGEVHAPGAIGSVMIVPAQRDSVFEGGPI